jgi:hypothetical protein
LCGASSAVQSGTSANAHALANAIVLKANLSVRDMWSSKMSKIKLLLIALAFLGAQFDATAARATAKSKASMQSRVQHCWAEADARWPDATSKNTHRNRQMAYWACLSSQGARR